MRASVEELAKAHRMKRSGAGYVGACPACGYKGALSVAKGTDGRALLHCHVGCGFADVARALGEPDFARDMMTRTCCIRKHDRSSGNQQDFIHRLIARSLPSKDTAVARYLAGRGIFITPPADLCFLPSHRHAPSRQHFPTMLALVRDVAGRVIGVHRTFLELNGRGKADVVPAKMTLGRIGSGAVRLHECGYDLAVLAISEGIETGLSVAEATGLPVWAALSAGGIERLALPPLPRARQIVIFGDRDRHGRGQRAANCAADRFLAEGRCVRIVLPPAADCDFNDLAMRGLQ